MRPRLLRGLTLPAIAVPKAFGTAICIWQERNDFYQRLKEVGGFTVFIIASKN